MVKHTVTPDDQMVVVKIGSPEHRRYQKLIAAGEAIAIDPEDELVSSTEEGTLTVTGEGEEAAAWLKAQDPKNIAIGKPGLLRSSQMGVEHVLKVAGGHKQIGLPESMAVLKLKTERPPLKKRNAALTLADDVLDPKNKDLGSGEGSHLNKHIDVDWVVKAARSAKKIVLDNRATEMMISLSESDPKVLAKMMDAARPMADLLWIEFPSKVMLEARRLVENEGSELTMGIKADDYVIDTRDPDCRTAMLIRWENDQIVTYCVEHTDHPPHWMIWPLGFMIDLSGKKIYRKPMDVGTVFHQGTQGVGIGAHKGAADKETQTRSIYGYRKGVNVKPLIGTSIASTNPSFMKMMDNEMRSHAVMELSGWTRITISCLAMLNSVTQITEVYRPQGRRLLAGASRPFLDRQEAVLHVPRRIKKVIEYVRGEIRKTGIRHRLHEVQPHYRHLQHQPRTPGWQEVVIEGETFWRKRIDGHLRGDPELGVVEHTHTVVKG